MKEALELSRQRRPTIFDDIWLFKSLANPHHSNHIRVGEVKTIQKNGIIVQKMLNKVPHEGDWR